VFYYLLASLKNSSENSIVESEPLVIPPSPSWHNRLVFLPLVTASIEVRSGSSCPLIQPFSDSHAGVVPQGQGLEGNLSLAWNGANRESLSTARRRLGIAGCEAPWRFALRQSSVTGGFKPTHRPAGASAWIRAARERTTRRAPRRIHDLCLRQ